MDIVSSPILKGSPSISDMNFDNGSETLTCTSSGGPATTVTWRKNCLVVQNSSDFVQNQFVTSTAFATYENTLMLNGANIDGVYTCSVKNSRGYSNSMIGIGSKCMFYLMMRTTLPLIEHLALANIVANNHCSHKIVKGVAEVFTNLHTTSFLHLT